MKRLYVFLLFLPACASLPKSNPHQENLGTCINYDKPQDVHPTHYWDGEIHLVPMFASPQQFRGFVIVYLPKDSQWLERGLRAGDVISEIDGMAPSGPSVSEHPEFFKKIKALNFKTLKVERCQKILLR